MDRFINLDLLRHPMNWLIVVLMVIIAGAGIHFILAGIGPAEKPVA
jgi:hypothetical protein